MLFRSVITYDATDNAGNTATQVTRTVIVEADLQLIQSIARAEFTLDGDGRFIRLTGRSNQSKFGFKVIDSTGNITLTQAGHFDWDSNSVDKVEMIVGDSIISSDDGAVSFSDDFMYAELGLLDGFGQQPLRVIVYAAGDTKGTAIAGPNLSAAPIISMV